MTKSSKTEQEALFQALVKLSGDADRDYYKHACNLYDKLSGAKYATCKSTYEFLTKIDLTVQQSVKEN